MFYPSPLVNVAIRAEITVIAQNKANRGSLQLWLNNCPHIILTVVVCCKNMVLLKFLLENLLKDLLRNLPENLLKNLLKSPIYCLIDYFSRWLLVVKNMGSDWLSRNCF